MGTFTTQSDLDVIELDELHYRNASYSMTEPEEEQGMEGTALVFLFSSESDLIKPCLHESDVTNPFEGTIIAPDEPLLCSEESPPVTLSELDDVSRLAELSEENVLPTCLNGFCSQPMADAADFPGSIILSPAEASCYPSKQNGDESVARNPKTDVMMTHSMDAANSFQKLLQFAMSQDPSETDATETSAQSVAANSVSTSTETNNTAPDSVVVDNQKRKGKGNKNKKNTKKRP